MEEIEKFRVETVMQRPDIQAAVTLIQEHWARTWGLPDKPHPDGGPDFPVEVVNAIKLLHDAEVMPLPPGAPSLVMYKVGPLADVMRPITWEEDQLSQEQDRNGPAAKPPRRHRRHRGADEGRHHGPSNAGAAGVGRRGNTVAQDFPPAEWVALVEEGGQLFVEARELGLYLSQPRRPLDDYTEAQRDILRRMDDLQARFADHGGQFHVDDELDADAAIFRDARGQVLAFVTSTLDALRSETRACAGDDTRESAQGSGVLARMPGGTGFDEITEETAQARAKRPSRSPTSVFCRTTPPREACSSGHSHRCRPKAATPGRCPSIPVGRHRRGKYAAHSRSTSGCGPASTGRGSPHTSCATAPSC